MAMAIQEQILDSNSQLQNQIFKDFIAGIFCETDL